MSMLIGSYSVLVGVDKGPCFRKAYQIIIPHFDLQAYLSLKIFYFLRNWVLVKLFDTFLNLMKGCIQCTVHSLFVSRLCCVPMTKGFEIMTVTQVVDQAQVFKLILSLRRHFSYSVLSLLEISLCFFNVLLSHLFPLLSLVLGQAWEFELMEENF